jgi:excisionase family DNA binding protein
MTTTRAKSATPDDSSTAPPQPAIPYRLLYRIPEVCALLSLEKSSVYDAIRRGELEAVRFRGVLRVRHEALTDFVANLPRGQPDDVG